MNDYVIAKYIRLSQDDAISESMSISHQRLLLDEYIEKMDMPNVKVLEFVDNGYTGTNLERPGFQEMIELMRCGQVNCIIVKDFSRFARNELESGYYIEQVFPLFQVRFIAIGDDFDSDDHQDGTGGMAVAFKFMRDEYTSKDLSKKVKTALRTKMERGENIVGGAIHGYRKNDNGKWEPDGEAADVIKLIFQLALEGLSTAKIRDRLFQMRIPTPKEYKAIKGGKGVSLTFLWPTITIHKILVNEQYIGSYVAGKHETTRIGGKGIKNVDRKDWIVIPDSHAAIISKEDFAKVQDLLARPKELLPKPMASSMSDLWKTRNAKGERKSSAVPYGYAKDENGDWVVLDTAASIVKDIYDMTMKGMSAKVISERLYELGYPTPSEQFRLSRGHRIQPTNRWSAQVIRNILQNEQYMGIYVAGKCYQVANDCTCCGGEASVKKHGDKKCRTKRYYAPRSEWVRIPNRHPAIISKDVFEQVQVIRANSRKNMSRRDYLLSGKAACGCCGYALVYCETTNPETYRCMKTHADPAAPCHKMKSFADAIEGAVMATIKKQAEVVLGSDNFSGFRKASDSARLVAEHENHVKLLSQERQRCYEEFVGGKISNDVFQSRKTDYTLQIDKLTNQLAVFRQAESDIVAGKKVEALAQSALCDTASDRDIVDALIEKVLVFPNNQLEIRWKFANFAEGM